MGSGKSTVGTALANRLDFDFVDLDSRIEQVVGISITSYFNEYGEDRFRLIERQQLHSLPKHIRKPTIVALGGGAPCFFDNMDFINDNGQSIYLRLSPKALFVRLQKQQESRPLLKDLNEEELLVYINMKLEERSFYYEKADHIVEADEKLSALVRVVEKLLID